MIAKTLFLVLLGTALVLSSPVPEKNRNEVAVSDVEAQKDVAHQDEDNESPDLNLFDDDDFEVEVTTVAPHVGKWEKLKKKWTNFIEKSKQKFSHLKEKWNVLKDKGLKFLKDVKETYEELKKQGKEALAEFKEVYSTVKETWAELKKTGKESYDDVKAILAEVKQALKSIKEKFNVKKSEQE